MAVEPAPPVRNAANLVWTTPNLLSLFRILLVPVLVYILRDPGRLAGAVAAILFVVGSLSDYYDGYLARKHGIVTTLGKFLDPLADKLLVVSVLIMLVAMPCGTELEVPCTPRVPAWLVVLIVGRELAVTGLRGMASSEGITLGDLKGTLEAMMRELFGDVRVRLRPSFFPYTEPSAEVDVSCRNCGGSGCGTCKQTGWLEILGSGMVHPAVFEAVGYDPEKYTGFAFGVGIERLALRLYGIDDIRMFYENDLRFLQQVAL